MTSTKRFKKEAKNKSQNTFNNNKKKLDNVKDNITDNIKENITDNINKKNINNIKDNITIKDNTNKISKKKKKLNNLKTSINKKEKDNKKERADFFDEIVSLLKTTDFDTKLLEQKIELAWMDIKGDFVNLIKQKNMYNKINILFSKGNNSVKYEIVKCSLDNIVSICSHEHSKQFIITLANDNKKYLVLSSRRLIDCGKELIINRNGVYVIDEIYKLCNRNTRNRLVYTILGIDSNIDNDTDNIDNDTDNITNDREVHNNKEIDNEKDNNNKEIVTEELDNKIDNKIGNNKIDNNKIDNNKIDNNKIDNNKIDNNKIDNNKIDNNKIDNNKIDNNKIDNNKIDNNKIDNNKIDNNKIDDNSLLIKKVSSKRLWKYEVTHHILYEYLNTSKNIQFIIDLFVRNKQLNIVLQSYKGLKASLYILNTNSILDIIRIISNDFINIVNNEYSVIFILKILELNIYTEKIIDLYTVNYKDIFINEVSVLPLLYIFNQEKKYYPTLFNHLRSKEQVSIDKKYLIKQYKGLISKHLKIFINSFTWILVYFLSKKDEEIKKITKEFLKNSTEETTDYSEKLRKKMIKYKLLLN